MEYALAVFVLVVAALASFAGHAVGYRRGVSDYYTHQKHAWNQGYSAADGTRNPYDPNTRLPHRRP